MPVTSKDLLDHLSDLQLALEDYSFEKMTVEQASVVKESYDHFRNQLETCIWGGPGAVETPEQQPAETTHSPYDGALSAIGHDLRNPLHGIMAFANVLAEAPLEEPYRSIASSMSMASESCLKHWMSYAPIRNLRMARQVRLLFHFHRPRCLGKSGTTPI